MAAEYIYGTGSIVESVKYSTVDELLTQIPDNTQNLIEPSDLRDAVFTLWERTSDAQSLTVLYTNENPVPTTVGGISAGSTFNEFTMQQMWDALLYPYVAPGAALTTNPTQIEYGNPTYLGVGNITLNWSATKNSKPITQIVVDGATQPIGDGDSTSGVKYADGTHSAIPGVSSTQTFTMTVKDEDNTTTANRTITWMNKIYWGSLDLTSLDEPNLTTNPESVSAIDSIINSSTILGLDGAGVGSGNQLATTKSKSYDGIDGGGDYLIFAWPSSVGGATTPSFKVNGLPNTAFTRIKNSWTFTNQYGFQTSYEVWISNTPQNSPIDLFEIS